MSKWQTELAGKAWNSLYWCNHDQPRMLSRMGNDSPKYREVSAKMLATCLHMMQGTPYVYQGEELGMTNYPFRSLDEFRDIESINAYRELTEKGIVSPEEMFDYISYKGRDNARTPMQWNDGPQAGFTTGTPWIPVNPNYREINAKEQMERDGSVFHYYKKLIRLRRDYEIIVYGDYELLLPDSGELYVYLRKFQDEKLLVMCNFTDQEAVYEIPKDLWERTGKVLISNYGREETGLESAEGKIVLGPYEAAALLYS
jgi:oligo-1,6-glucosidase